jgi:hypothetical protein
VATLLIAVCFSFTISVLAQDYPDYTVAAGVAISIIEALVEQLATCVCVQHPCVWACVRKLFEKIGNYIQILVLLASFIVFYVGVKIFAGKNGSCTAVAATEAGGMPTCDHHPGTYLCNPSFNASSFASPAEAVNSFGTLGCRFSGCEAECLSPASMADVAPVLRVQGMSLAQAWLVVWPLANSLIFWMQHRKQRRRMAKDDTFFAPPSDKKQLLLRVRSGMKVELFWPAENEWFLATVYGGAGDGSKAVETPIVYEADGLSEKVALMHEEWRFAGADAVENTLSTPLVVAQQAVCKACRSEGPEAVAAAVAARATSVAAAGTAAASSGVHVLDAKAALGALPSAGTANSAEVAKHQVPIAVAEFHPDTVFSRGAEDSDGAKMPSPRAVRHRLRKQKFDFVQACKGHRRTLQPLSFRVMQLEEGSTKPKRRDQYGCVVRDYSGTIPRWGDSGDFVEEWGGSPHLSSTPGDYDTLQPSTPARHGAMTPRARMETARSPLAWSEAARSPARRSDSRKRITML